MPNFEIYSLKDGTWSPCRLRELHFAPLERVTCCVTTRVTHFSCLLSLPHSFAGLHKVDYDDARIFLISMYRMSQMQLDLQWFGCSTNMPRPFCKFNIYKCGIRIKIHLSKRADGTPCTMYTYESEVEMRTMRRMNQLFLSWYSYLILRLMYYAK